MNRNAATIAYGEQMEALEQHLARLSQLLPQHATRQARQPENWGFVGDLAYINELLGKLEEFLKGDEEADAGRSREPN